MRVASLFVVVVGIGLFCGCQQRTEPTRSGHSVKHGRKGPGAPHPNVWAPEELVARLARVGINVSVRDRPLLNRLDRTVVAVSDDLPDQPATVLLYHCLNEADAREQAASMGAGAFVNGRYAIGTRDAATARDRELLAQIEIALNAPIGQSAIRVAE